MKKFSDIVGDHPQTPSTFGVCFSHTDKHSQHNVPIRSLNSSGADVDIFVEAMRGWIRSHHASPKTLKRDKFRRKAFKNQGFEMPTSRFPTSSKTRKGNWAEVMLCEYIAASSGSQIPIYRLRFNPNIEQSMKGDDMLAFDVDADPVRIIIGEAKFRSKPSKQSVDSIIQALEKSHKVSIPMTCLRKLYRIES